MSLLLPTLQHSPFWYINEMSYLVWYFARLALPVIIIALLFTGQGYQTQPQEASIETWVITR